MGGEWEEFFSIYFQQFHTPATGTKVYSGLKSKLLCKCIGGNHQTSGYVRFTSSGTHHLLGTEHQVCITKILWSLLPCPKKPTGANSFPNTLNCVFKKVSFTFCSCGGLILRIVYYLHLVLLFFLFVRMCWMLFWFLKLVSIIPSGFVNVYFEF